MFVYSRMPAHEGGRCQDLCKFENFRSDTLELFVFYFLLKNQVRGYWIFN